MTEQTLQHGTEEAKRFSRFLAWFAVMPLFFYLLPFAVLRVPGYEDWNGGGFAPGMEFAFQTKVNDADVVIFGDSTAMVGIDPIAVSRETGLKVLNLPNTVQSLPITGEIALRRYLARSRPPKLIVLYFTPWTLDYERFPFTQVYEGVEMLIAHGTVREIFAFGARHPLELLAQPLRFYPVTLVPSWQSLHHSEHKVAPVEATMGHFAGWGSSALTQPCAVTADRLKLAAMDSVVHLRAKYGSSQTKVLVFIAPIPDCSKADVLTTRSYAPLNAAPPKVMPAHLFKGDGSYSHLLDVGVPQASSNLAAAIRAALPESASPPHP